MLLPVQVNSPDRASSNAHDPVLCSQVKVPNSFTNLEGSRDPNTGQVNVSLSDGTAGTLCPAATFNPAPPIVSGGLTGLALLILILILILIPILILILM